MKVNAVVNTLYAQRYKPVTFQGKPITAEYTFNVRLALPRSRETKERSAPPPST